MDYRVFHEQISAFKKQYIPHHPDEPPILHREEIVNRRGHFSHLQDPVKNQEFDDALIRCSGKKSYVFCTICFRFEHSLIPLTPSPTLCAGEGEPQTGRSERTPLPPGEGIKG
jgi:hypothetical protein